MSTAGNEDRWWFAETAISRSFHARTGGTGVGSRPAAEELNARLDSPRSTPIDPGKASLRRTWAFPSTFGAKTWIGEHDVLLGFGLIATYCVVALLAMVLFPVGNVRAGSMVATIGVTLAIDSALLGLFGRRIKGRMLLCFPILLVASELALSLLVSGGEATEFTGFFTLMFVFIGLTQSQGVGPLFALIAGAAWAIIQRPWTAQVGVKLVLALAIWVLISEVLAARTERVRIRTRAAGHAGEYRRVDGPRKPALSLGPHRARRGRARRLWLDASLHRPGRVQADQRHLWPFVRR